MKKIIMALVMVMSVLAAKAQYYGYIPMPQTYCPPPTSYIFPTHVPESWGYRYAGPMKYSSDPCLNAIYGVIAAERSVMNSPYYIAPSKSSTENRTRTSLSSSHGSSVYECPCSNSPSFGLETYHKCSNCGRNHLMGGYHSCPRRK